MIVRDGAVYEITPSDTTMQFVKTRLCEAIGRLNDSGKTGLSRFDYYREFKSGIANDPVGILDIKTGKKISKTQMRLVDYIVKKLALRIIWSWPKGALK